MRPIDILLAITLVLSGVIGLCYSYQMIYMFVPFFWKPKPHKEEKPHRFAILIAARNEEAVLPHLLDSILGQSYSQELVQVFVVADNCTDRTAQVARDKGAVVFERFNKEKVGKGYAMNYLLDHMKSAGFTQKFDAFLILDADNILTPGYLAAMNRTLSDGYEIVCGYRNSKNFCRNWVTAGYGLWYLHDSVHLNRSRMLLGTSCTVSGTGFLFTRSILEELGGWNFFTLTEDIEFNAYHILKGKKIGYCHEAMLYDEQPITFRQSWRQRIRWSQGGLQVTWKYAPKLFVSLLHPNKTWFARLEMTTNTLLGAGLAAFLMVFNVIFSVGALGWSVLPALLFSMTLGGYWAIYLMGAMSTITEWKVIPGTPFKKILYTFTFPFFMMTFPPIAICAIFSKFEWKPIAHSEAMSLQDIQGS